MEAPIGILSYALLNYYPRVLRYLPTLLFSPPAKSKAVALPIIYIYIYISTWRPTLTQPVCVWRAQASGPSCREAVQPYNNPPGL
eukprot:2397721-Pyramimonas_sp.AAC.1